MCDETNTKHKSWKVILGSYFISLLALGFSAYTFWDNYFHFKLDVAAGRQIKLWIAQENKGNATPVILMSLAFTNSGGKTEYLQDVKLDVVLTSNNRTIWNKEFTSKREYDTFLTDASMIKQVELLPIVIVGKTTEIRKYVFWPIDNIEQSQIPESFDLIITVCTKRRGEWKSNKVYEVKNISGVWHDLGNQSGWSFAVRDIFEKI